MPRTNFTDFPDNARVWVFASDRALQGDEARALLNEVDDFLDQWQAHGSPLRSAREWKHDRFLAIAIDPTAAQASGCSIDGLFRRLQSLEAALATGLVGGGRVFFRDAKGNPQLARRSDVPRLRDAHVLTADTPVFDTSITDARTWRERFERPARETWLGSLLTAS